MSASELRANIYRILDQILETGIPVEIERGGRILRIEPADRPGRLSRIVARPDFVAGDPDELVAVDWSDEWKPDRAP